MSLNLFNMDAETARAYQRTNALLEKSVVLADIRTVIHEIHQDLVRGTNADDVLEKLETLEKACKTAEKDLIHATKQSTSLKFPISAMVYAVNRTRKEKANEELQNNQPPAKRLRHSRAYISVQDMAERAVVVKKVAASSSSAAVAVAPEDNTPPYPPPANGVQYTPAEVIDIYKSMNNNNNKASFAKAKKDWIEQNLVGCKTVSAITRMVKKVIVEGKPVPEAWGITGRPSTPLIWVHGPIFRSLLADQAVRDVVGPFFVSQTMDKENEQGVFETNGR
jgi:hypothetical protein